MRGTNRGHVLDVAFDLFRARVRLRVLNAAFGLVALAIWFARSVDQLRKCECDSCRARTRVAEIIAPWLFTIETARVRARDHIKTATFALSWVTLTPFRYYVPAAVLAAPFRPPLRLLVWLGRKIAAVFEFLFDAVRTGAAMLVVLQDRLEKLPRPWRPSLEWLHWPQFGRQGSPPRLSRRLTSLASLVLPAADHERYAEEWHEELLSRSRIHRATFVIGIWRKLPAFAWGLHTYARRQAIR